MTARRFWIALVGVALAGVAATASAQTRGTGRWEIEVHAGATFSTNPSKGTIGLPGPGEPFTTATTMPTPPPPSRRESSWYFGDGALLFNQAVAALGQLPGRITALDPVLARSLTEQRSSGNMGVRVSRALTGRLSAEVVVDYGLTRLAITQANRDGIEATRASFAPAFVGLIAFNPNRVVTNVASAATTDGGSSHQLATSALLTIDLRTTGRVIPYASIGGGVIAATGARPTATLRGNYQFLLPGGAPVNETDTVTVRDAGDGTNGIGILAGGVKYRVGPQWGIRLDARLLLSSNAAGTVVDAVPNVALGLAPAGRGVLGSSPSIQFSNNSTDPVAALGVTAIAASTLTGPALNGLQTFSGSGVVSHTRVAAGVFWRF